MIKGIRSNQVPPLRKHGRAHYCLNKGSVRSTTSGPLKVREPIADVLMAKEL